MELVPHFPTNISSPFCLLSSITVFIGSYIPKWLINAFPLPPLCFYEQNLSRYRLRNRLTIYCSTDILFWHRKYAEPSANIFSIQHTFIFRRGRLVLCNFVKSKTNTRVRCKLSVNCSVTCTGERKLSNFATKLNFVCRPPPRS